VKRIIIDTDPGVDDALAILAALNHPEVELLGVVSEPGNVPSDVGARNVIRLFDAVGAPRHLYSRVYRGAVKPLVRSLQTAEWVHGSDGLGDAGFPPPSSEPRTGGVRFLIEVLESSSRGEVSILCLGPLTNIALAVASEPDIAGKVKEVVSMGGWFGLTDFSSGNVTPVSEFNIYNDPEAAKIVYEAFSGKLKAVGLDVTTHPDVALTTREWELLRSSSSRTAQVAARVIEKTLKLFGGRMSPHDPLALLALLKPDLFTFRRYPVVVSLCEGVTRGQTVLERREWLASLGNVPEAHPYVPHPVIEVAADVKAREALSYMLSLLTQR